MFPHLRHGTLYATWRRLLPDMMDFAYWVTLFPPWCRFHLYKSHNRKNKLYQTGQELNTLIISIIIIIIIIIITEGGYSYERSRQNNTLLLFVFCLFNSLSPLKKKKKSLPVCVAAAAETTD